MNIPLVSQTMLLSAQFSAERLATEQGAYAVHFDSIKGNVADRTTVLFGTEEAFGNFIAALHAAKSGVHVVTELPGENGAAS